MSYWLILIIAIPSLFFVLAFVVGCFENLYVCSFEPMQLDSFTPYMAAMLQQVTYAFGFQFLTSGWHRKYKDRWTAALYLSPDARVLAVIAEGQIYGMRSKKTTLMSRFADGSVLTTADEAGTADLDPKSTQQILMHADFTELLQRHVERASQISLPQAFQASASWDPLIDFSRTRIDRIVGAGLGKYVDCTHECYRYTPWGSFRATIVHGIRQVLTPCNHWRNWKSRPSLKGSA